MKCLCCGGIRSEEDRCRERKEGVQFRPTNWVSKMNKNGRNIQDASNDTDILVLKCGLWQNTYSQGGRLA